MGYLTNCVMYCFSLGLFKILHTMLRLLDVLHFSSYFLYIYISLEYTSLICKAMCAPCLRNIVQVIPWRFVLTFGDYSRVHCE
jgi:hypothetical protein